MSTGSVHAEIYERTNINSAASSLGVNSGSNRAINLFPRNVSAVQVAANGIGASYTLSPLTSAGLTQFGRNGATVNDVYGAKNGVDLVQTAPQSALGASLPSHSFYVGGANVSGSLSQARAASVGYAAWGAALTSGQRSRALHRRPGMGNFRRSTGLMATFILLAREDRDIVAGPSGIIPGRALLPIERMNGVFILGAEVLDDPAHAPHRACLSLLPQLDGEDPSFPAATSPADA